jgi:hypothetical protein
MPFLSTRWTSFRIGAMVMHLFPSFSPWRSSLRWRTFDGRNVGESTTFTAGLLYVQREVTRHEDAAYVFRWLIAGALLLIARHRSDSARRQTPDAGGWRMIGLSSPTHFPMRACAKPARSTIRRS